MSAQDGGYYLFDSPHRFALRPDIVVTREDGSRVVLDTKWKRLSNDSRRNYGISQADMYQMYAYSNKYDTPEVWLLYPSSDEMRGWMGIAYSSNDGVCVSLFFVDVAREEESLTILRHLLMR